jgi:PAS domain-containing protein
MQRFLLVQNILRFRRGLEGESDGQVRRTIAEMLAAEERELAKIDAVQGGVGKGLAVAGFDARTSRQSGLAAFRNAFEASATPLLLLDPRPGLRVVDMNAAYAGVTLTDRLKVAGEHMFDLFPDNPDDPLADGVRNLYASLTIAANTGRPHRMPLQRYDIRDAAGFFVERYWQPVNKPLVDQEGRLVGLLHQVEDVTEAVLRGEIAPAKAA